MTNGAPKRPRRRAHSAFAIALLLTLAARAGADAPSPVLKAVVTELADEAIALVKSDEVPKGAPDYAERCTHDITPEEIGMALTHRTHREPFVDAYVRWQLTSFDAPLPEMDERAFLDFMDETPAMIENPRADAQVLALFERAEDAGKLPARDLERLRATYDELATRSQFAELMNRPAVEFREYIASKLGETGVKPRLWLLEECLATVNAGWATRSVKTRISKSFLAASNEANFPREHLRLLAEMTPKLADNERQFVSEITMYADGVVNVSFSTAGVSQQDVEKWVNRLAGVP